MKKIERLKSSVDSNSEKETVGEKFAQLRDNLNEIIDYINDKEEIDAYKQGVEKVVNKLTSEKNPKIMVDIDDVKKLIKENLEIKSERETPDGIQIDLKFLGEVISSCYYQK